MLQPPRQRLCTNAETVVVLAILTSHAFNLVAAWKDAKTNIWRTVQHLASVKEVSKPETEPDPDEAPVLTEEFAAMSLTLTKDIDFASYSLSSISSEVPTKKGIAEPNALVTLPLKFNAVLDSACTNHIISDRHLFHTYKVSGAVPVKMTNCRFLTTLAVGDVKFHLVVNGTTVV